MNKLQCDAVILDVDGTLWDSTPIVAKSWQAAAIGSGLSVTITPKVLQKLFGKTMDVIAAELLPGESEEVRRAFMAAATEAEQKALETDPCHIAYPGVVDTIEKLSKKLPLAIVSNCQSGYIELFMEKTGSAKYITDTECFGDTGFGKAENIKLVMERNNFTAPVYVGDTEGDRAAAEEAGVRFIWASYGFGKPASFDDRISTFSELLKLTV